MVPKPKSKAVVDFRARSSSGVKKKEIHITTTSPKDITN